MEEENYLSCLPNSHLAIALQYEALGNSKYAAKKTCEHNKQLLEAVENIFIDISERNPYLGSRQIINLTLWLKWDQVAEKLGQDGTFYTVNKVRADYRRLFSKLKENLAAGKGYIHLKQILKIGRKFILDTDGNIIKIRAPKRKLSTVGTSIQENQTDSDETGDLVTSADSTSSKVQKIIPVDITPTTTGSNKFLKEVLSAY